MQSRRGFLASAAYALDEEKWRRGREAELKADTGWLTVVGLEWLEEGVPREDIAPGTRFLLAGGKVSPESARWGTRTYTAIQRGGRFGIRVRDTASALRRDFTGLRWYPVDPAWRVVAQWRPHAKPEERWIDSVGGIRQRLTSPGVVEFRLGGSSESLEAFDDGDQLFFVFKDDTARTTTYPGGRFLYTPRPAGGKVVVDFNRAENPPCAFTPYATCPLAPRRNWLAAAVTAGEKRYHD
jgi:uncharacterized protein (DUF1684 family)